MTSALPAADGDRSVDVIVVGAGPGGSATAAWLAKAGAVAYVIWGLLHVQAAWKVYSLGQQMADGMERARVLQNAWNLLCFALIAIVAAVVLNWRNSSRGWWINLVAVSATDIGFIAVVLAPGYMPLLALRLLRPWPSAARTSPSPTKTPRSARTASSLRSRRSGAAASP